MLSSRLALSAVFAIPLLVGSAAGADPCAAASSTSDVTLEIGVKNQQEVFQEGEIIPLVMRFRSTGQRRYWADVRNYDRSGRLGIEGFCVDPAGEDPLASYFGGGRGFAGGGMGSTKELSSTPFMAEAELNEWWRLKPGKYRLHVISRRVWRAAERGEDTGGRVEQVVRSNAITVTVRAADPEWQSSQLRSAVDGLAGKAEEARQAARKLRFLDTPESARALARLYGRSESKAFATDLMFGMYGSRYRERVIEAMHAEFEAPDHGIGSEYLGMLVNLRVSNDRSWDFPSNSSEQAQTYWKRLEEHKAELTKQEIQSVVEVLSRKKGSARAMTLQGVLTTGLVEGTLARELRPALIEAWPDLPQETQQNLIEYRWASIAGPEMAPVLRRFLDAPPAGGWPAVMSRDAALQHLYELDPATGQEAILRDLENVKAQPSLKVVALLRRESLTGAVRAAAERIGRHSERELDYELVDRYGDSGDLGSVRTALEGRVGKLPCTPQAAMLRYLLRVAPEDGARQVSAVLAQRKGTGCYRTLLQDVGAHLPKVQEMAIAALDDGDSEVVRNAAGALSRWGTKEAEKPLWARVQRFRQEWEGRADEVRQTGDYRDASSQAAFLEQELLFAIAKGTNWLCAADCLSRLAGLGRSKNSKDQLDGWLRDWKQPWASISPLWSEDGPKFIVLQYVGLTEEQLRTKLSQLPRGMELRFQLWPQGRIFPPVSMEKQEAVYERIRKAAEEVGVRVLRTRLE